MSDSINPELAYVDVEDQKTGFLDLLKSGVPSVVTTNVPAEPFKVYVAEDDSGEVKLVKQNVEFVVQSARDCVEFLKSLGQSTGNPRYFEAVNSFLNTIINATNQLNTIDRIKKKVDQNNTNGQDASKPSVAIQNNVTLSMSTSEALEALSGGKTVRVIEAK